MNLPRWIKPVLFTIAACVLAAPLAPTAFAGVKSEAVEGAVRFVKKKFDKEVSQELGEKGNEVLARKMQAYAARYGEKETIEAARRVGPQMFRIVEEAGEQGPAAIRLLARNGDEAIWIASRKKSLSLFARHGDEAADAMIKHKEIAEGLIDGFGAPAANALRAVDGQNARRLAMMHEAGELARLGRAGELLNTVGRYGDNAMNWIWRNKGALATATVLAAFLNDPQPFIDGTVEVAEVAGQTLIRPVATEMSRGIAGRMNWTLLGVATLGAGGLWISLRMLRRKRPSAVR